MSSRDERSRAAASMASSNLVPPAMPHVAVAPPAQQQFGSATYPTSAASHPIQSTFVQPTAAANFFPTPTSRPPTQFSVPPPAWPGASGGNAPGAGGMGFPPGMPPPPVSIPGGPPPPHPSFASGFPPVSLASQGQPQQQQSSQNQQGQQFQHKQIMILI